MNFSYENARAKKLWFTEDEMWLELEDARKLGVPKVYFPRLCSATSEELSQYELSGGGMGIHWDALDEDIYVPNLLLGIGDMSHKKTA